MKKNNKKSIGKKKKVEKIKEVKPKFHDMTATTNFEVEHTFTPEEMISRRDLLVATLKEKEKIELQRKSVLSQYNKLLKDEDTKSRTLCDEISTGKERKKVDCVVRFDFDKGEKYVIHPDTSEIIYTYELDLDDLRLKEEFEEAKRKKKKVEPAQVDFPEVVEEEKDEVKKEETTSEEVATPA